MNLRPGGGVLITAALGLVWWRGAQGQAASLTLEGPQEKRLTRHDRRLSPDLQDLSFINVPNFQELETDSLRNLSLLRSIYILNAPKLQKLPKDLLRPAPTKMRSLRIMNSGLLEPPDMGPLTDIGVLLHIVDLENNKITKLPARGLCVRANQLILDNNDITEIEPYAFAGSELAELSLRGNKNLRVLHEDSFSGIIGIRELDISGTSIVSLPVNGLATIEILKAQNVISMKTIPSIYDFKLLKKAWLTHHFHCCAFHHPEQHHPERHADHLEYIAKLKQLCLETHSKDKTRVRRNLHTTTFPESDQDSAVMQAWGEVSSELEDGEGWVDSYEDQQEFGVFHQTPAPSPANFQVAHYCGNITNRSEMQCWPHADALNPCSDVLGSTGARVAGWAVGGLAVLANAAVAAALLAAPRRLSPAHLLQVQLALADLCTAVYLTVVTAADTSTAGVYFNHAYDWQYGPGCQVAGFLAVGGAQASLLALAALTLERWLAITRALHPHRRLSPRSARIIMSGSLLYSLLAASLPLFGVSDYSSSSICLPMRSHDWIDISYLVVLILSGALSVVCVVACYAHIYYTLASDKRHCAVRAGEASIANKMAILILTHMICCVPVGAAGAGALAGAPMVDVRGAKLLLVLVYPLNALADPFLYAILTHQFRRDVCLLLSKYGICTRRAQQYKIPGGHAAMREARAAGVRASGEGAALVLRAPARSLTTACDELLA